MTSNNDFEPYTWQEAQDRFGEPTIDAEFVPEDAERPLYQPQWQVFLYYGQHKFDEATKHLQFVQTKDGLYHYVDRRDGTKYSLPVIERVKEHRKDERRVEVQRDRQRADTGIAFAFWAALSLLLFTIAGALEAGPESVQDPAAGRVVMNVFVAFLFVVPLLIGVVRLLVRYPVRPLPAHVPFLTDEEIAEARRREAQRNALAMAATVAYVAHKYRQHERHELAEEIVNLQERRERGTW
jgi:hypothetical protein